MNASKEVVEFWEHFCAGNLDVERAAQFQFWHFGNSENLATELVGLVLAGTKRATASLLWEYEAKPDEMPTVDVHSVVTDFGGLPKCVVRTTEVRLVPFNEVDADFAFDEGEGDQSLDYWRGVHWDYFNKQCLEIGEEPSETMPVICERFELLYPISKN